MNEMNERDSIIFKRDSAFEESNIKRMRLDDDDDDDDDEEDEDDSADSEVLRSLERTVSASDSGGFFSAAVSEEEDDDDDHQSSSFSSGCSSSETNEIARDTRLPFLDLEAQQISETETDISTLITNNFRKQRSSSSEILGETAEIMDSATTTTERRDREKQEKTEKSPTQAELDDFFSSAERYQQKRFTEKYNYDIVNDTPLEGRYEWVSLEP